jgi:hypothetical protein
MLLFVSFRPEMVDFGSGQGRSAFETTGVVSATSWIDKRANADLSRKMSFMDGHG